MKPSQDLTSSRDFINAIHIPHASPPGNELTVSDLLSVISRRRGVLLITLACFVAVASVFCALSTRLYMSTAEIQVQKEGSSQLGLDNSSGEDSAPSDALQDNITLQTQVSILESDSLALKVIHDLNLAETSDFKPKFNPIGFFMGLISPRGASDAQLGPSAATDMGMSPRQRLQAIGVFRQSLKVKPVAGTRLIDISYLSSDPRTAAEVVNRLAQGLSDYNFETRHNATARTAKYLTDQLADLRKQSQGLQAQLARAQRDSGIVSLGGLDAMGREQVYSSVLDKLQQATTAYTQAQSNRIAKEAVYEAAKTGDPEAISTIAGSTGSSGSGDNGLALIQSLRLQQATLKSALAEAQAKFGTGYPKITEMQQQVDAMSTAIKTEVSRMAERSKNDAEMARQVETSTRRIYQDLKTQADAMNDKTVAYTIMKQEADQSRTLYETLFKQLKEAGVLADFKISNISTVDPGRVAASPARPKVLLILVGAIAAGLFFGCCGAFLADTLDSKIRSLPELEHQLGRLPLGVLPYYNQQRSVRKPVRAQIVSRASDLADGKGAMVLREHSRVVALNDPRSAYVEALRALRTSILLSRGGSPPQVLLITSSIAAEGKSMLSVNLATLLAQQGKNVMLVDADFRRPNLHRTLNLPNGEGLSSFLAGQSIAKDPTQLGLSSSEIPGLTILPAGPIAPFPTELLGSKQMQQALTAWRKHFDFIVIDGAPVLPVTDSVIVSTMVDFTLLVARHEVTQRQSLDRSFKLLQEQTDSSQIGVVLNAVNRDSSTYYQYYGYKDSVYYGTKHA